MKKKILLATIVASTIGAPAFAGNGTTGALSGTCSNLPTAAQLKTALGTAVTALGSGKSFGLPYWATMVDDSGKVCAVVKLDNTEPWLGSRVISAQKANTANAFSTKNISLSTAKLYSAVQPGGSLYGLQHSNPVNTLVGYRGDAANFGAGTSDPMVGLRVGGVNVFGGGVALYNTAGEKLGAVGVSGDTACADHYIAWEIRKALSGAGSTGKTDKAGIPGGTNADNIIYDITANPNGGTGLSASGFGHAECAVTAATLTPSP